MDGLLGISRGCLYLSLLQWAGLALTGSRLADGEQLLQAGQGFARLGSWIVLLLSGSGVIQAVLILGPHPWQWWHGLYGRLLLLKLGLFALMLLLAASHRWLQLPRLQRALQHGTAYQRLRLLRASIGMETALAVLVLAVVTWLGHLDPAV